MTAVQHIYEGEGSPLDLGIQAPAGSHYIDKQRTDHVWVATFHDPIEPYTEWLKLERRWPPFVSDGGSWGLSIPVGGRATGVMTSGSGQVQLSGTGTVLSNVELVTDGGGVLRYMGSGPFMFQAEDGDGGATIFTVTPLTSYSVET